MALKSFSSMYSTCIMLLLFLISPIPTGDVQALPNHPQTSNLDQLDVFSDQVRNGHASELRGVYIPEILTAQIVGQPEGRYEFVSPWPNFLTQFGLASRYGSIGLVAHNHLAGDGFSLLNEDQDVYLVYGDGEIRTYVVREILRYQALEPDSYSSDFKDLGTGSILTASELFLKVYDRPGMVIFQTCISTDTSSSWGRLFVIAEPYPSDP